MKLNIRQFLFAVSMVILLTSANVSGFKLWYDKPASVWNQALPIGNGRFATMYFGAPLSDRLQFNGSAFHHI
jgi:alpha-L-fucosidase 2